MARTRRNVIEDATADPNEVLVVFDNDGVLENHLLRDQPALKVRLAAASEPADRTAAEAAAFAAAEAELDAPPSDLPTG
jgi:hypothetical protein